MEQNGHDDSSDPYQLIDPQLWVVSASDQGERSGLIATFVTSVSIVPEERRFVIAISKQHYTGSLIDRSAGCGLHLFSRKHIDWVQHFGMQSGRVVDKFSGLETTRFQSGAPILTQALAAFDCEVEQRFDLGDRTLFQLKVLEARQWHSGTPLQLNSCWAELDAATQHRLSELLARDQQIDLQAILQWRSCQEDASNSNSKS